MSRKKDEKNVVHKFVPRDMNICLRYCFSVAKFAIISSMIFVRTMLGGECRMSRISTDAVKHVAHLARLAVTDEEVQQMTKDLDDIISFAEQLNEVDTTNVKPTSRVLDMVNVLREDKAEPGLPVEEVMKNAPNHKDGLIRVPSIMD